MRDGSQGPWRGENDMRGVHEGRFEIESQTDPWIKYGDELLIMGQVVKALEYYDRALKGSSKYTQTRAWQSKANALDAMGKYNDAIECYDSALSCDPEDAECWFNKGILLKKMGQENEGATCIHKAIHFAMGHQ